MALQKQMSDCIKYAMKESNMSIAQTAHKAGIIESNLEQVLDYRMTQAPEGYERILRSCGYKFIVGVEKIEQETDAGTTEIKKKILHAKRSV